MSKESHPVFFEIRESFSRLNSMVEENIGGNRVVKAFSQEPYEIEKFNKHNEDYKNGIWLPQMSLKIFTVVRRFCV